MYITAQGCRLRNDLYCVEWNVKLYYTILYFVSMVVHLVPEINDNFMNAMQFWAYCHFRSLFVPR